MLHILVIVVSCGAQRLCKFRPGICCAPFLDERAAFFEAQTELKTLRAELASAQTSAPRSDDTVRERDATIASLQQQVRRLEPLAARYREAELRLGAVSRDRDAEVAGLRARVDEIEGRLREARDQEARLRARVADESGESLKARARP